MKKHMTWHITCRNEHDWRLEQDGELLVRFDYKDDAIREGRRRAYVCEMDGGLAHLVVHRQDGTIEHEMHSDRGGFAALAVARPPAGRHERPGARGA
jgi:hypothetical protein